MKKDSMEAQTIVEGFLKYLEDNDAVSMLPEIASLLSKRAYQGSKSAKVFSAVSLSDDQTKTIEKIVRDQLKAENVSFEIDEHLIGGLKVIVGNQVLDLSYLAKLNQLSQS